MSTDLAESRARHGLVHSEYIALASLVTATIAISIDTILPAFDEIEQAYSLGEETLSVSLSITIFFAALGLGNLLWGPLADRFGRKPTMFVALAAVALGAILASVAPTFNTFLASRALWGVAAAGPRTIILAVTRDCYEGDAMSRIMSLTLAVFLIVPVLAPGLGEALLFVGPWQLTTLAAAGLSIVAALWFGRIEETLRPQDVMQLDFTRIRRAATSVLSNRHTMLFTLAATMTYGAFFPWLGSSPTLIGDIFGFDDAFALIFGANAVFMAVAIVTSERLVRRYSTMPVVATQSILLVIVALVYVVTSASAGGAPPFWLWFVLVTLLTALNSSSSPLFQSLAMEPMGAIAGTAASVIGAIVFVVGAVLGSIIDSFIDTSATPFGFGFLIYGAVTLVAMKIAQPTSAARSAG